MLAILSLLATASVAALVFMVRVRVVTFRDDFTGFNAMGFVLGWGGVLLLTGTILGGLAWQADRRSWVARSAFGLNAVLLAGAIWLLVTLAV